jgi:hypothetical protein
MSFAAYADLGGMFHTELAQGFIPAALELAKDSLSDKQSQCIRDAMAAAREALIGGGDTDGLLIVRFDEQIATPAACAAAFEATPGHLEGAKEAYSIGKDMLVHEPGILLFGSEALVTSALHPPPQSKLPTALALAGDQYLAWTARIDESLSASGKLFASQERFRIDVDADVPEPLAMRMEDQFRGLKGAQSFPGLEAKEAEILSHLIGAADFKRSGNHVTLLFELREGPVDQARDLGAAASVAIYSVRSYLRKAKTAEAKSVLGQIARGYVASWEKDASKTRAKKKLVSFPAVPKAVPMGTKYQSSASDWKAWQPIGFSLDAPQYFQYEVRAAKDGQSADIIARGDLNGDGKTSQFRLIVKVDRTGGGDTLTVSPNVEETNPEE